VAKTQLFSGCGKVPEMSGEDKEDELFQ
jgi:hypothetical protein